MLLSRLVGFLAVGALVACGTADGTTSETVNAESGDNQDSLGGEDESPEDEEAFSDEATDDAPAEDNFTTAADGEDGANDAPPSAEESAQIEEELARALAEAPSDDSSSPIGESSSGLTSGHRVGPVGVVNRAPFSYPGRPHRNGAYYISPQARSGGRPIIVIFHGYKDSGDQSLRRYLPAARKLSLVLWAPDAYGGMWQVGNKSTYTRDARHVMTGLAWLRKQLGARVNRGRVSAIGHSLGTRMAAHMATTRPVFTSVVVSHGRFLPETLGSRKVPAYFTGSPLDDQFYYPLAKSMAVRWGRQNHGPSSFNTFSCSTCKHMPHTPEYFAMLNWASYH